ncbi:MAG: endonuclease [Bacteroidales bacterium]|nr:endonuclease [Bacteroidales bacterium]
MNRSFLLLVLMCPHVFPGSLSAQTSSVRGEVRIMWYNVENMFYPADDTLPGDDEFTPDGVRYWTYSRYRNKITQIAKLIIAAGEWEPPDLVGLGEIEEARILEDLVQHPILQSFNYNFLHRDSPDRRGMDVACLYRENRIGLVGWNTYPSPGIGLNGSTRDIVHVCGIWGSSDTMDLFLVHFISKFRGAGATAEYRKIQAGYLVHLVDSVRRMRENSLIVLTGDFNEEIDGYSMEPIRMAGAGGDSIRSINPECSMGSYKYRGQWSRIDQFLVSGPVTGYRVKGSILDMPVLLTPDNNYGGMKPARTYEGYSYRGGVSDHLPILLDISRRAFSVYFER